MTDKPSRRHAAAHSRLSALHLAPDSLAFALDCAAQAVGAVRAGSALPAALQTVVGSGKHAAARGAVQDIAYRAMRSCTSSSRKRRRRTSATCWPARSRC
jgi:16S rRNA (cytosine967-C5)-methyltransferase